MNPIDYTVNTFEKESAATSDDNMIYVDKINISREGLERYKADNQTEELMTIEEIIAKREELKKIVMDPAYEYFKQMCDIRKEHTAQFKRDKGGYDWVDVAQSMLDAYAKTYAQIEEDYANGTIDVLLPLGDGDLTHRKMTKEDALEFLNQAYERTLCDLGGFLSCQETNAWARHEFGGKPAIILPAGYKEKIYESMKKAQEEFEKQFKGYETEEEMITGTRNIVSSYLQKNSDIWNSVQLLFADVDFQVK